MLRRAENVHVAHEPLPSGPGWLVVHVGRQHFRVRRFDQGEFRALMRWASAAPQRIATVERYACWMYRGDYFWDDGSLDRHQIRAVLEERLAGV